MTDQIIYDKVWLDGYLNQLKQYEDDMRLIKDNLYRAETSISLEKSALYMAVMQEIDKIEYNFQLMHSTIEKFMNEAQSSADELKRFIECCGCSGQAFFGSFQD